MSDLVKELFAQIAASPEEEVNLAEAALLIAKEEYPHLDVPAYLHRLDSMAANIQPRLGGSVLPEDLVGALNHYLFQEEGFAGNTHNYYDPRNSFLNEVLDRKLGIPITLSVVYMEVGWRLGLPLAGVSFPGHFLVKYHGTQGSVVLDPFSGGIPLSQEDLQKRLRGMYGSAPAASQIPRLLASASKKEILARMLRNLKNVYLQKKDFHKALSAADRILLLRPNFPPEVRDRGIIYQNLECFQAALHDYQLYLKLAPQAPDAGVIRSLTATLQRAVARLN